MKVEIYRYRWIADAKIEDEVADRCYEDVENIQLTPKYLYGTIHGEQLTVKLDHQNYAYYIGS